MSAILDRAKAHFAGLPPLEIMIPEWGDEKGPVVITWTALTIRDRERINMPDEDGRSPTGGIVMTRAVILKACDANGRRLFDDMAEHDLRHNVDGEIIGRIANAILYGAGIKTKKGKDLSADKQIDNAKND